MKSMGFPELEELKKKITDQASVDNRIDYGLCDMLIAQATPLEDRQSIAFGHVWRAHHFFYTAMDLQSVSQELDAAQQWIDEAVPCELLEKYYTLRHLLCENSYNIQAAFGYCIKALETAEQAGLSFRVGANYGNISHYYMDIYSFPEALHYSLKAREVLGALPEPRPGWMRLLLINQVGIYLKLDKPELAREAIEELCTLPLKKKDLQVYVDYGYLLYYAALGEQQKSLEHLQNMFEDGLLALPNRAYIIELLTNALEAMLRLRNEEQALRLLVLLQERIPEDELERQLPLCQLQIQFVTLFGPADKLPVCYRRYYTLYMAEQEQTGRL